MGKCQLSKLRSLRPVNLRLHHYPFQASSHIQGHLAFVGRSLEKKYGVFLIVSTHGQNPYRVGEFLDNGFISRRGHQLEIFSDNGVPFQEPVWERMIQCVKIGL